MFLSLLALFSCGPANVALGGKGESPRDTQDDAVDTDTGGDSDTAADTGRDSGVDTTTDSETDTDTSTDSGMDTAVEPELIAIDLVDPSSGSTRGGDTVVLYGGPFSEDALVRFGTALATVAAATNTTLTVTTPPGDEGVVDVAVSTATGEGAAVGAFQYVRPCEGVTPDRSSITMDLQTVNEATITLTGCATGIQPLSEVTNFLWFSTYPSSVDGTDTVTLHGQGSSSYGGYQEFDVSLATDQGNLTFHVRME